jgi:hypothetical protein
MELSIYPCILSSYAYQSVWTLLSRSIRLAINLFSLYTNPHLSLYLSAIFLFIYLSEMFVLFVYLSSYQFICLCIYVSIYVPPTYLSIYLSSKNLSISLAIYLDLSTIPINQNVYISTYVTYLCIYIYIILFIFYLFFLCTQIATDHLFIYLPIS